MKILKNKNFLRIVQLNKNQLNKIKNIIIVLFLIVLFVWFVGCDDTPVVPPNPPIEEKTTRELLKEVLDSIEIPASTSKSITLYDKYKLGDVEAKATWQSLDKSVMSDTGEISIKIVDQNAKMFLKLTYLDETITKTYDILVLRSEAPLLIFACFNEYVKFDSYFLENDVSFSNQFTIDNRVINCTWESLDQSIIDNTGKITKTFEEKEVEVMVTLEYDGYSESRTLKFTVAQDPDTLPSNYYHKAETYLGEIANESPTPTPAREFPGAIYHKVVSSRDCWLGIEGTITLPTFIEDEARVDSLQRYSKYLDNASVYMGGNSYYESDVGLTWSIGFTDSTLQTLSNVGIAFRPFWRYTSFEEPGKIGYAVNTYKNANVKDLEYYYFPGDKIRMSVYSTKVGYMQLRIELLELTTIEKYKKVRDSFHLEENFSRVFLSPEFTSRGMGNGDCEYKRVNAIDQAKNEGKPTLNTNAKVVDAIWHEVYLYRKIDNTLYKVPFTSKRGATTNAPSGKNVNGDFKNAFYITYDGVNKDLGGEVLTINPNNGNGKLYN